MTIYQIDPSQAASGLRYQFAKDLPALVSGDEIDFRNGFYHPGTGSWGYSPSTNNFEGLDNFTVANYGTGMRAVLDPRLFEDPGTTAGWSIVRTTGAMKIWRKLMTSSASATLDRLWFGATRSGYAEGQRTDGVAYARLSEWDGGGSPEAYYILDTWTLANESLALDQLEDSPLLWAGLRASGGAASDRVIYVKVLGTGSDYPPAVYGGFAFTQRGASTALDGQSPSGIIIRDGTNYLIDGICAGGDRAFDAPGPTTKDSTAIIRNVTAAYFDKRGIAFNTGAAFGWTSVLIEDFIIDSITSEEEQDPTSLSKAFLHSSEGVEIATNGAAAMDSVMVQGGDCNGIGHGGIAVTGVTGTLSNVVVRFNKAVSPSWQLDVRHYVMQGTTGSGNKMYGNVSDNQDTKCEFGGESEIYGNWFLNNRIGIDSAARQVARIGGTAAGPTATNFRFHHNFILGTNVVPFRLAVAKPTAANAITIDYNVIQLTADAGTRVFETANNANLDDTQIIRNNHVEVAGGVTPTARWKVDVEGPWTSSPAGFTGTWTGNTTDTRLSEIPTSLYPPSMAAEIFG